MFGTNWPLALLFCIFGGPIKTALLEYSIDISFKKKIKK